MGPGRAQLLPRPRRQPSVEEQQRGHKKELWPRVGQRGGEQRGRSCTEREEESVEEENGGDMTVHESSVAD